MIRTLIVAALSLIAVVSSAIGQTTTQPTNGAFVRFDIYNGSLNGCTPRRTRSLYTLSGQNAHISLASCEQYVLVSTTPNGSGSEPNIGIITLSEGPPAGFGPIQLQFISYLATPLVAPPGIPTADSTPVTIGNNLAGITTETSTPTALYGGINGDLTGNVTVGQLANFKAAGTIAGSISANSAYAAFPVAFVDAGTISGSVTLAGGTLARVKASSDGISGNISASTVVLVQASTTVTGNISASSSIVSVVGPSGIGPSTGLSTISAPIINVINSQSGPINAIITANGTATSPAGAVQRLRGTSFTGSLSASRIEKLATGQAWTNAVDFSSASSATISVSGSVLSPVSLAGGISAGATVSLGTVSSTVSISGDLNAPMSVSAIDSSGSISIGGGIPSGKAIGISNDHAGSLSLGSALSGTVLIGHSLTGSISLPASGLAGQVIVNAAGVSGGNAGTWTGSVSVGGFTLAPTSSSPDAAPFYTRASSALGGGAVGLAPFRLYADDSTPVDPPSGTGTTRIVRLQHLLAGNPILMRFYGPVNVSGSTPLTIEWQPLGWTGADTWLNVAGLNILEASAAAPTVPAAARTVALAAGSAVMYGRYRISNPGGGVTCAQVTGSPAAVIPGTFWRFDVIPDCDGNSIADMIDIAMRPDLDCNHNGVLDMCEGIDPNNCPPALTCHGHADWNNSGSLSVQDLFDFLNSWFAGCRGELGGACNGKDTDYDGSGTLDTNDVFTFINDWFAGCQ